MFGDLNSQKKLVITYLYYALHGFRVPFYASSRSDEQFSGVFRDRMLLNL